MSVDEQVDNLISLGLKINDIEHAKKFLNDVSYFRFIKAYSLGLKPKNSSYYDNVTFDMLEELYLFNSNFRQLIFIQIERVEVNLRCRLANYFSNKYGVLGYKDAENFIDAEHHKGFLYDINEEISRNSKSPFVKNFRDNYENGDIPFYALVELFSFGTLSKFYKNMKNEDKKAVAQAYGVGYTYLQSWFEHLAFVRNICAHYGRLYNYKFPKTPMLYKEYSNIRNNRIFATLLCFKYIIPNDKHWEDMVISVSNLLNKYPHVKKEYMGFPDNWRFLLTEDKKKGS